MSAVFILNESLTFKIIVGTAFVITGVISVERSIVYDNSKSIKFKRLNLIYPLTTAVLAGFGVVFRKIGLNIYGEPILGVAIGYLMALCIYALILSYSNNLRKSVSFSKHAFIVFGISGIFLAIGWLLSFYAIELGRVIIVSPLLNLQSLFIVVLSFLFLKKLEAITVKLIIGTIMIILGAVFVTI